MSIFLEVIDCRDREPLAAIKNARKSGRNFLVICSGKHGQKNPKLSVFLSAMQPLDKAGLLDLIFFLQDSDFFLLKEAQSSGDRVYFVEQIALEKKANGENERFVLYHHPVGILSEHANAISASTAMRRVSQVEPKLNHTGGLGVFRFCNGTWERMNTPQNWD